MPSGNSGRRRWIEPPHFALNSAHSRHVLAHVPRLLIAFGLLVVFAARAVADDQVRDVQQELRKRHLYFGDIDGRSNAELIGAIKRYQSRKGFAPSGRLDHDTAASLGLTTTTATTVAAVTANPAVAEGPVLKSEFARELTAEQREQLEKQAEAANDIAASIPAAPAESPPPSENLTPERVTKFVEDYLRDGEAQDEAAQMKYYEFPVEYFDDGMQDAAYVARDTRRYVHRFPERKFMLSSPVTFFSAGNDHEAIVEFTYAYQVRSKDSPASGQAKQRWRVRVDGDQLKIVAIQEQNLRRK
jgi:peptidoglycan hydrolase-like protein with peptidoglycan-binding domain